jgi:hypothetical protein
MTGQGKSKFVKDYIQNRNCFVFDVQNEYTDLSPVSSAGRARHLDLNEKLFVAQCSQRRNTICVFEEATGFFEGRLDKEVRRLVLSKRHTGNVFIFCFHSIQSIPPRLMQFTNYVVLFKTMDEPYQVDNKFPTLYPYYLKVRDEFEHQQFLIIKTIPQ